MTDNTNNDDDVNNMNDALDDWDDDDISFDDLSFQSIGNGGDGSGEFVALLNPDNTNNQDDDDDEDFHTQLWGPGTAPNTNTPPTPTPIVTPSVQATPVPVPNRTRHEILLRAGERAIAAAARSAAAASRRSQRDRRRSNNAAANNANAANNNNIGGGANRFQNDWEEHQRRARTTRMMMMLLLLLILMDGDKQQQTLEHRQQQQLKGRAASKIKKGAEASGNKRNRNDNISKELDKEQTKKLVTDLRVGMALVDHERLLLAKDWSSPFYPENCTGIYSGEWNRTTYVPPPLISSAMSDLEEEGDAAALETLLGKDAVIGLRMLPPGWSRSSSNTTLNENGSTVGATSVMDANSYFTLPRKAPVSDQKGSQSPSDAAADKIKERLPPPPIPPTSSETSYKPHRMMMHLFQKRYTPRISLVEGQVKLFHFYSQNPAPTTTSSNNSSSKDGSNVDKKIGTLEQLWNNFLHFPIMATQHKIMFVRGVFLHDVGKLYLVWNPPSATTKGEILTPPRKSNSAAPNLLMQLPIDGWDIPTPKFSSLKEVVTNGKAETKKKTKTKAKIALESSKEEDKDQKDVKSNYTIEGNVESDADKDKYTGSDSAEIISDDDNYITPGTLEKRDLNKGSLNTANKIETENITNNDSEKNKSSGSVDDDDDDDDREIRRLTDEEILNTLLYQKKMAATQGASKDSSSELHKRNQERLNLEFSKQRNDFVPFFQSGGMIQEYGENNNLFLDRLISLWDSGSGSSTANNAHTAIGHESETNKSGILHLWKQWTLYSSHSLSQYVLQSKTWNQMILPVLSAVWDQNTLTKRQPTSASNVNGEEESMPRLVNISSYYFNRIQTLWDRTFTKYYRQQRPSSETPHPRCSGDLVNSRSRKLLSNRHLDQHRRLMSSGSGNITKKIDTVTSTGTTTNNGDLIAETKIVTPEIPVVNGNDKNINRSRSSETNLNELVQGDEKSNGSSSKTHEHKISKHSTTKKGKKTQLLEKIQKLQESKAEEHVVKVTKIARNDSDDDKRHINGSSLLNAATIDQINDKGYNGNSISKQDSLNPLNSQTKDSKVDKNYNNTMTFLGSDKTDIEEKVATYVNHNKYVGSSDSKSGNNDLHVLPSSTENNVLEIEMESDDILNIPKSFVEKPSVLNTTDRKEDRATVKEDAEGNAEKYFEINKTASMTKSAFVEIGDFPKRQATPSSIITLSRDGNHNNDYDYVDESKDKDDGYLPDSDRSNNQISGSYGIGKSKHHLIDQRKTLKSSKSVIISLAYDDMLSNVGPLVPRYNSMPSGIHPHQHQQQEEEQLPSSWKEAQEQPEKSVHTAASGNQVFPKVASTAVGQGSSLFGCGEFMMELDVQSQHKSDYPAYGKTSTITTATSATATSTSTSSLSAYDLWKKRMKYTRSDYKLMFQTLLLPREDNDDYSDYDDHDDTSSTVGKEGEKKNASKGVNIDSKQTKTNDALIATAEPYSIPSTTSHPSDMILKFSGQILSHSCQFAASISLKAYRFDMDITTSMAVNYSFFMMLACLVQIVILLRQLLYIQNPSSSTRISVLCIGWQTLLDALLCFVHILLAFKLQNLFTAFASVSFFKMLLFCVIEMKYMAIILQARERSGGATVTAEGLRRIVSRLHTRFYIIFMFVSVGLMHAVGQITNTGDSKTNSADTDGNDGSSGNLLPIIMLVLYSFWIPQIVLNIVTEAKRPMHVYYIYGMSLSRLVAPLYVFGLKHNFMQSLFPDVFTAIATHNKNNIFSAWMCELLCLWVGLQCAVLIGQGKYGARFMIPQRFLPPKFDYSRPLPPSLLPQSPSVSTTIDIEPDLPEVEIGASTGSRQRTNGSRGLNNNNTSSSNTANSVSSNTSQTLDCVICYSTIDPNNRRGYMLGPCDHIFHRECLIQWMEVKMECPTCRMDLPAI